MSHPTLAALVETPPTSEAATHLEACAACRVLVRQWHDSGHESHAIDGASLETSVAPARASLDRGSRTGPAIGETLGGYTLEEVLGAGALGTVYGVRGRDGNVLALKRLTRVSPQLVSRFRREARLQASLDHPNIVRVHGLLTDDDGVPGILMERVAGPSLDRLIDAGPLPVEEAVALIRGALAGLARAHREGIVHRDLKPANLLLHLTDEGVGCKVGDFGLAKGLLAADSVATATGATMGTPATMAPEQMRDASRVDPRADLFSLGCTLYAMLTGLYPFEQPDPVSRWEAISAGSYTPLQELCPEVPPVLAFVVASLLQPEPARRPDDAATVIALLAAIPEPRWEGSETRERVTRHARQQDDPPRPALRTSLPELPELVGRSAAIDTVTRHIERCRLVTVHGPGGMGKTALTVTVITAATTYTWPGGATWVSLGEARSAEEVERAVSMALGLRPDEAGPGPIAMALAAGDRTLVVLDAVEGCLDGVRGVVKAVLDHAEQTHLLVTSRTALGMPDEVVFPLPGLEVSAGADLYANLAPRLHETDRLDVDDLVVALGGVPLAIRLAAARYPLLTPRALLGRISEQLSLLDGADGALTATLASSWELLEPELRAALSRLVVFVAPFPTGGAEAVLGARDALRVLPALEARAWIVGRGHPVRFQLHLAVREFVRHRVADPPWWEQVVEAHDGWVVTEAERVSARLGSTRGVEAISALESLWPELESVVDRDDRLGARATLVGLVLAGRVGRNVPGARLVQRAETLATLFEARGDPELGASLRMASVDHGAPGPRAVHVLEGLLPGVLETSSRPRFAMMLGRALAFSARRAEAEAWLDMARRDGDPATVGRATLVSVKLRASSADASALEDALTEILATAAGVDDVQLEAEATHQLGTIREFRRRDATAAAAAYTRAHELYRRAGDPVKAAHLRLMMAAVHRETLPRDALVSELEAGIRQLRAMGQEDQAMVWTANLATLEPDRELAEARFLQVLDHARRRGHRDLVIQSHRNVGITRHHRGRLAQAVEAYDAVLAERERDPVIRCLRTMALAELGHHEAAEADRARLAEVSDDALLLEILDGCLHALTRDLGSADRLIAWARSPEPASAEHPHGRPPPVRRHADYNLLVATLAQRVHRTDSRHGRGS